MHLDALTFDQCETVRKWRNLDLSPYRTPYLLTEEMQAQFYDEIVCNQRAAHRYYAVMEHELLDDYNFVAMVGLVNISLENRSAEISLVVDPARRGQGVGKEAVKLLLEEGFYTVNLDNIYGECYKCNRDYGFWINLCTERGVLTYELPRRKFSGGVYWDSIYFNFIRSNMEV